MHLNQLLCLCLLTVILCVSPVTAANLNNLHTQIANSKQTKAQIEKQQKQLEKELEQSEKAISDAYFKVRQTQNSIVKEQGSLATLRKNSTQLKENKIKQQSLLEEQLTSAYMSGENDLLKLLLNQEDLSKISRARGYYDYLNQARLDSIDALELAQKELEDNEKKQIQTIKSLEQLQSQQKQTQLTVNQEKNKRDSALKALQADINYQNKKIAQLNRSEQALRARLKKASEARKAQQLAAAAAKKRAEQALTKFSTQKGKLEWPVKGRILNNFGDSRSSQVKWKGMLISANEGEKVQAVAAGRVLFAGYFKGYGMVVALDHNDNYITLYGYNQTLLHKAGDKVYKGEAIALAGHSGGQDRNSLYFELSHKGTAQNPLSWLSRR